MLLILSSPANGQTIHTVGDDIRAVYLTSGYLLNNAKIEYLLKIINETEINAVVIDIKDSHVYLGPKHVANIKRFKDAGAYVITRIVAIQDSTLATNNPALAIRNKAGEFWHSGRIIWKRFWVDPTSIEVVDYNFEIARRAIDAGADEINFDYIRFPSDGNMADIVYPKWDGKTSKYLAMSDFFGNLTRKIRAYKPEIVLSVDVFGYVYANGQELTIGQRIVDISRYFDVICPMAYPSHFRCGEFGLKDPNLEPFIVYNAILKNGLRELAEIGSKAITRPWIQDFSITNIYRCGYPAVKYDAEKVGAQIKASRHNGINGFMLWNAKSRFTIDALGKK
jgi:hypothetical protein